MELFKTLAIFSSLLVLRSFVPSLVDGEAYTVTVDGDSITAPLKHFWESTGFCPPLPHEDFHKYALSDDEYQNLADIGSVPRQGIKQVRIHWLFDLVTIER